MRKIFNLQKHHFATASICAVLVGVSSVLAIGVDLYWLISDAMSHFKSYHISVGVGLFISLMIALVSFIYLYRSIKAFEGENDDNENKYQSWLHVEPDVKSVGQVDYDPADRDDS